TYQRISLLFAAFQPPGPSLSTFFPYTTLFRSLLEKAAKLRAEYVVAITGRVEMRSGAVNENLATGEIEIIPESLRILSESETPRSEEHTSELQSRFDRVCRLLLEKTKHWRRPE